MPWIIEYTYYNAEAHSVPEYKPFPGEVIRAYMLEVGESFIKQGVKFYVWMIKDGFFHCISQHCHESRCRISIKSQERVTLVTKKIKHPGSAKTSTT